jgi:hypothetical protein
MRRRRLLPEIRPNIKALFAGPYFLRLLPAGRTLSFLFKAGRADCECWP